ncbi:hypothetical protein [Streptomyces akebiae]|uniref:Uncharacterized protein n=1 Tax=Streptomyces akebiae TaxID=2865673 RepID=A0ABX8Y207_9ACTN|nr:hypothetical protein [Streptomyces akebiae]QYX81798.1 hypothetical protein K1J60_39230 [Streptomyces akebiae]
MRLDDICPCLSARRGLPLLQDLDGVGVHADFAHATYRTRRDDALARRVDDA